MALVLEVTDGSQKGLTFRLEKGRTFGRRKADYILKDDNVSGTHCQVDEDEKGNLILRDLDSANGLVVNSHLVKKIRLIPGVVFLLGSTTMRVKEVDEVVAQKLPTVKKWPAKLKAVLEENPPDRSPPVLPFQFLYPYLQIEFVEGLQAETVKVITFGPRQAGFGSLDLHIEEADIPQLAFELYPLKDAGIELVNRSGPMLKLNESVVDKAPLHNGDVIQLGRTKLRIRFI